MLSMLTSQCGPQSHHPASPSNLVLTFAHRVRRKSSRTCVRLRFVLRTGLTVTATQKDVTGQNTITASWLSRKAIARLQGPSN